MNYRILNRYYRYCLIGTFILGLVACKKESEKGFISSATLESDLWKVSSTVTGTITDVFVREGDSVSTNQVLALLDTIPIVLKIQELHASVDELKAQISAREAEVHTLNVSHKGILREVDRIKKLVSEGAATSQRLDDLETQKETSVAKMESMKSSIVALSSKHEVLKAQENNLLDQLKRCTLTAPSSGIILTKYRNHGEIAIPGRPVVELGRTDTLWADFFIPQTEVAKFKIGQALKIRVDMPDGEKNAEWIPAKLTWISSEAEFTPKGIQTREARNELIFHARAMAGNPNGILKRGMPVELWE